jgi:hypothetical protein
MKRDFHAEVSARIVAELEAGAAPWVKPWSAPPGANTPCNAVSNRPYSGCNVVLLWMDTSGRVPHAALPDVQPSLGIGRQRTQGRARHEGVFREATPGSG